MFLMIASEEYDGKVFILGYSFLSNSFVNDFPFDNICKLLPSRTGRIRWNLLPGRSPESFKELRYCLESRFPTTEGSISIPKCYVQTVLEGVPMPISRRSSSCWYTTKRFKMQWHLWTTSRQPTHDYFNALPFEVQLDWHWGKGGMHVCFK